LNFLAHSFFSPSKSIVKFSNMLADSIKGSNFTNFNSDVIEGIVLHRKLDEFIDNHPSFTDHKQLLYPVLGKFSSIAIDMFFDYFMVSKILNLGLDYHSYCFDLQLEYHLVKKELPSEMLVLGDLIFERKWLFDYSSMVGMQNIMNQMSKRIKDLVSFSDAIPIFENNKSLFMNEYENFYQKLIDFYPTFEYK
jgi:acyl carrier protein phosphodiesterase